MKHMAMLRLVQNGDMKPPMPSTQFLLKQAQEESDRVARGVPYAKLDNIEATVFFRFLAPEQQEQIRLAVTDDEKRALFARFIDETETELTLDQMLAAFDPKKHGGEVGW